MTLAVSAAQALMRRRHTTGEGRMGRPILRLATRINRRTRWTAWAIAFACMVLVGSLSLVDGLSAGVDSVTARFSNSPALYLRGSDLLASAIDPSSLSAIPSDYTVVRVHTGTLTVNGTRLPVIVASLTQVHDGNATVPFPADPDGLALDAGLRAQIVAASGAPPGSMMNLSLFGLAAQAYPVDPAPASRPSVLPDTWAWVRPELLASLSPAEGTPVQAALTPTALDPALVSRLGLTPLQTVGAIGFTQASVAEARSVLLALDAVVAAAIALLVFSAMGLEVHARAEEIRTLRSLGASPRVVAAVYEGQALVLALLGAALGSALGVVAAHGLVSFAPLLGFPNLVILPLPVVPVALAFVVAVLAAGVAGIVPASRAVRVARAVPEAVPS